MLGGGAQHEQRPGLEPAGPRRGVVSVNTAPGVAAGWAGLVRACLGRRSCPGVGEQTGGEQGDRGQHTGGRAGRGSTPAQGGLSRPEEHGERDRQPPLPSLGPGGCHHLLPEKQRPSEASSQDSPNPCPLPAPDPSRAETGRAWGWRRRPSCPVVSGACQQSGQRELPLSHPLPQQRPREVVPGRLLPLPASPTGPGSGGTEVLLLRTSACTWPSLGSPLLPASCSRQGPSRGLKHTGQDQGPAKGCLLCPQPSWASHFQVYTSATPGRPDLRKAVSSA